MSTEKRYHYFLHGLALVALAFILLTTWKYGAGVSSDAARNLSTVDSLLAGRGFVDMTGGAFVWWPPLYPLLLAGLSWLTGLDPFNTAWYLNVLLFTLNTWLCGWLFFVVFREKPAYALMSSLTLLFSRSLLSISANVSSEPLFMTLMLAFFFGAGKYLQRGARMPRYWMFVLAGLATLHRHPGVVFFVVGGLVVLYREGFRGALRALPGALLCILPAAGWAVLHTYPLSGGFFGPRNYESMLPLENLRLSMTKIMHWFVPYVGGLNPLLFHPWLTLAGLGVVLALLNRKREIWRNWVRALMRPYVWPGLLFAVIYFLLMAFTVVTADHRDLTSDRYYIILLPALLVFLFITMDRLVLLHLDLRRTWLRYGLVALFTVWLVYPIFGMGEYLRQAWQVGEPSNYNIQNSRYFQDQPAKQVVADLLVDDSSALVYSNYLNIIWFYYRPHPVSALPFHDQDLSFDERVAALRKKYPGWPGKQRGYIIWFTPNEYHHIASPEELAQIADLTLLYRDNAAQVYRVQER